MSSPRNVFRCGDKTENRKITLQPQSDYSKGCRFDWSGPNKLRHDMQVRAVRWEIYTTTNEDLDTVLWNGSLSWDFTMTLWSIAPLSFFGGGLGALLDEGIRPEPREPSSDLEKLAALAKEEEFKTDLNDFKLGAGRFFRGFFNYMQYPVSIPADTSFAILLRFDEPLSLLAPVRIRVCLEGATRTMIEIG